MAELHFYQVDVFTDRVFGGNPLAVFPDAEDLTGDQMQNLAREMNLSETTFVLPPEHPDADFKVRIFTPTSELPFAGHPVIGTHWLLAEIGRVDLQGPVTRVSFELGVGVLPAELHVQDGKVKRVVMTQGQPKIGPVLENVAELARGLGTTEESISEYPAQISSTGIPQLMVGMQSLADVNKLDVQSFDNTALNAICAPHEVSVIMVYSLEASRPDVDVHTRGFAPMVGIPEDPATGSANGALGAYLVHNGLVDTARNPVIIQSEQGIEMGRPSQITIEVEHDNGKPSAVRVAGSVVPVLEGVVRI